MSDTAKRTGPLAGVKIIDMSSVVLGPFATLIFGDLGAEVIKIEAGQKGKAGDMMRYAGASPTGDLGPIYTSLNRNKKSVQLDAKTEDGKGAIVVGVTDDLADRFSAVDLVRVASEAMGGKGGGGRPDMAQAGGPDGDKGVNALDAVRAALAS